MVTLNETYVVYFVLAIRTPRNTHAHTPTRCRYAFYSMIRDRFLAYNGTSFEEDNMGSWTSQWSQTQTGASTASEWWQGFATPWCEAGIPVQVCESTAGDVLESLLYGCVTSSRDNIDDVPGTHQSNGPNDYNFLLRWRTGFARLLLGALAVRPFFDNVWTMPFQNASSWGTDGEYYLELAWALSVLTAGAVGFGDLPGNSNVTLIATACMDDGTLLQASLPSFYLDDVYLPTGDSPLDATVGRVFQAPTAIPDSPAGAAAKATRNAAVGGYDYAFLVSGPPVWTTVLAVDVGTTFPLLPVQLTPDLSPDAVSQRWGAGAVTGYVGVPWTPGFQAIAAMCGQGAPAAQCVLAFTPSTPLAIHTGVPAANYTHDWELYSLSPVYACGYSLLGELDVMVRVSEARFSWVSPSLSPSSPGLTFAVVGSPGEVVSLAVLAPPAASTQEVLAGTIQRVSLSFPSNGGQSTIVVTCKGVGGDVACTSSL